MQRNNALATLAALFGGTLVPSRAFAAQSEPAGPLQPPAHGLVNVAIVIGPDLVPIDAIGPAAAFGSATLHEDERSASLFNQYAVGETADLLDVGGLKLQPQYTFQNAPQPDVLVVPQQRSTLAAIAYVRKASKDAAITMSVCTGAFLVARAGLFDGLKATTHHNGYDAFEKMFPKVTLVRGARYVENPKVSSAGGESSGIDLALRVIERYYGTAVAKNAAYAMEYRRTPRPQSLNDV